MADQQTPVSQSEAPRGFLRFGSMESSMRLAFMIIIIVGSIIAIIGTFLVIWLNRSDMLAGIAGIIAALFAPSFIGKAAQSFSENRPS